MSRILITGGAGFVGSHLAKACLKADHQVHVVVRPGSSDERLRCLGNRIVHHRFDLGSEIELKNCLAEVVPNVIFHLAWSPRRPQKPHLEDARDTMREDVDCLIALLDAAADNHHPPDRLIRAGSLAEYGLAPLPYREDAREAPVTAHGAGLVAATHYINALQSRLPFPVATARMALVYGPSQSIDYLLPALITRCLAGDDSIVWRPSDRRDLIYVEDAVAALLRMAAAPLPPAAVINISTGIAPTMREVAHLVIEQTGVDPDLVRYRYDSPPSGAADLRGSPERAHSLLGWQSRIALAKGLERTVNWYRSYPVHKPKPDRAAAAISPNHAPAGAA
jgi:nucleoside-diphosphate-sugar epimerase